MPQDPIRPAGALIPADSVAKVATDAERAADDVSERAMTQVAIDASNMLTAIALHLRRIEKELRT